MIRKVNITLGIIGGAGPLASSTLYNMLIENAQKNYGAKNDNDFPKIVVINFPFSPMILQQESDKNKKQLRKELQNCFTNLSKLGVSHAIIACNTLHSLIDQINMHKIIVLSLVEQAAKYCKKYKKILVLGTQTTKESGLYSKLLKDKICYSQNQEKILEIINSVLQGKINNQLATELADCIKRDYKTTVCDAIILGCTELSVINKLFSLKKFFFDKKIVIIDPLEIVTKKILHITYEA